MLEDIRFALKPGMVVKVYQKIKDVNPKGEERERVQIFQGTVLAVKHGKEAGATVTVRKVTKGFGVEKIFPLNSPLVEKIELVREMRVRQSRAYYLRDYKKKLKAVRPKKKDTAKAKKVTSKKEEAKESKPKQEEPKVEKPKETPKAEPKKTEEKK